eukprot:71879_1
MIDHLFQRFSLMFLFNPFIHLFLLFYVSLLALNQRTDNHPLNSSVISSSISSHILQNMFRLPLIVVHTVQIQHIHSFLHVIVFVMISTGLSWQFDRCPCLLFYHHMFVT